MADNETARSKPLSKVIAKSCKVLIKRLDYHQRLADSERGWLEKLGNRYPNAFAETATYIESLESEARTARTASVGSFTDTPPNGLLSIVGLGLFVWILREPIDFAAPWIVPSVTNGLLIAGGLYSCFVIFEVFRYILRSGVQPSGAALMRLRTFWESVLDGNSSKDDDDDAIRHLQHHIALERAVTIRMNSRSAAAHHRVCFVIFLELCLVGGMTLDAGWFRLKIAKNPACFDSKSHPAVYWNDECPEPHALPAK